MREPTMVLALTLLLACGDASGDQDSGASPTVPITLPTTSPVDTGAPRPPSPCDGGDPAAGLDPADLPAGTFWFTFDNDLEGWEAFDAGGEFDSAIQREHGGEGLVRLDGSDLGTSDGEPNAWISRSFDLASTISTLAYRVSAHDRDGVDTSYRVRLESGGKATILADWETLQGTEGTLTFQCRALSLAEFAGATVTLVFEQQDNDIGVGEQVYLDDIVIR